jgi:HAMP domain-containing protein
MRWKLLIAFGVGFTLMFLALAWWILRFTTNTATDRLKTQLKAVAEGSTGFIDLKNFDTLKQLPVKVVPGAVYPDDAGILAGKVATADSKYPTDASYWKHNNEMADIRRTSPDASPYTFYIDPNDGKIRFLGSWGALGYPRIGIDQPGGATLHQAVDEIVDRNTMNYMRLGFQRTTFQPAYTDTISSWISVYTPLTDKTGRVVGAVGVDYDMRYVNEVRSKAVRALYPVFVFIYVLLMGLVFLLSSSLTRRLGRLSSATRRVADGDYDVDLQQVTKSYVADEMTDLALSFRSMADKVGKREKTLVNAVAVLKVEIDEAKRKKAVDEITDTDFFANLSQKAGAMRAKVKASEELEGMMEKHGG